MPREINDKSRFKQGRGIININNAEAYIPWIKARDCFHGDGTRHILPDLYYEKRQIHLMSDLEMYVYYMLRANDKVIEVFEQYPLLPGERTEEICREYNIKHPQNQKTKKNIVMTTDFLYLVKDDRTNTKRWTACAVKPKSQLDNKRVRDKLFIEQKFWEAQNIKWGIITEEQVDKVYVDNVILCKQSFNDNKITNEYDMLKYLIVHKLIKVDMYRLIDLDEVLHKIKEGKIEIEKKLFNPKRYNNDWIRILENLTKKQ